jgi:hypothetical protein
VDRAISECDALTAGFTPYTFYHASVPQLLSEVRGMRNQLTSIRQMIGGDDRRRLRGALRTVNTQMQQVDRYWSEAVGGARLTNAPSTSALRASVERLSEVIQERD